MRIYFPNQSSMKCFVSEVKANEFVQREGGHLVPVPAFEFKDDAQKWIQEQEPQDWWHVSFIDNSILVDAQGKPLKGQTTRRKPGEPTARARRLEKPDYIYCVESNV